MRIRIGEVEHYYKKIGVAVVNLDDKAELHRFDSITIKGSTTFFEQRNLGSIEIDHQKIDGISWDKEKKEIRIFPYGSDSCLIAGIESRTADSCAMGLKVRKDVRKHDIVYKYIDDEVISEMIDEVEQILNSDSLSEEEIKLEKARRVVNNHPVSLSMDSIYGPWLKKLKRILR